ncbi:hypothetical protein ABW09_08000 [Pluralibacter gergoviae]|uniref:formylglycine-generating enzyme family protein n=1 Tax=Pluralibacter gergoviae TaxID=61647 RepID=UPI0006505AA0|nr:SUMF1/EgtB/PvdO family nonheme iron enzyme [Pluralibacter gergoviae]KMK19303.1 hypothetical protein ABW09_08000 [Pluralibacter gergoviae]
MQKIIIVLLLIMVTACDNKNDTASESMLTQMQKKQLENFLSKVKSQMVYMPEGAFLMGDFCSEMRNGGMFCTIDKNNKPVHRVGLSAFSISKFKITHEDYSFYLNVSGYPPQSYTGKNANELLMGMTMFKNGPAIVSWSEAESYCMWLKKQTGLSFSLPTEAQWEYAARDKGKYVIIATDDGTLRYNKKNELGENYATDEDRRNVRVSEGFISELVHFAVDKYPPSPAGLYGMADNGKEWVLDWYDPDWYTKSPLRDPQGPEQGVIKDKETGQFFKVLRGATRPAPGRPSGLTFSRSYQVPEPGYPAGITARCVVNDPHPLNTMPN